ncbi:aryl-sulfate sulfotransferase [Aurantibacillus circumpalustris]|uniref:aryl-sulfate sulfotransferase n=1 Tax=Aurantibacillus circumpalustris TaxID=3036359 RepID=UPI00295AEF5E|nr:aryl-sulfate sulfotransferase [Aurantibacillus circumpalustris]
MCFTKRIILLFLITIYLSANAQKQTGLIKQTTQSTNGYVLFAPLYSKTTYLIDKCGNEIHSWKSKYIPGQSVYLLPNGSLLRTCTDSVPTFAGDGGKIEKLDWNSKVLWQYSLSNKRERRHHDVYPMPNGNVLMLVWEKKSREEAIKAGRDSMYAGEGLWNEKIIELKPVGTNSAIVVWEWSVWDHLIQDVNTNGLHYGVISENPQLININYSTASVPDWLHFNSVVFNPAINQILVSNRNFGELFIIDHSTTIKQAASHSGGLRNKGGDLLYRWGNPESYNQGSVVDKKLFNQHSAFWIANGLKDAGKIMVFNNGLDRPGGQYSSVEVIVTPINKNGTYDLTKGKAFLPDDAEWKYSDSIPVNFYSRNVSSAQRLSNGNTLICEGANGKFFEIDKTNKIVWTYINPVSGNGIIKETKENSRNQVFRCTLYEPNYSGLKSHLLTQGKPLVLDSLIPPCQIKGDIKLKQTGK